VQDICLLSDRVLADKVEQALNKKYGRQSVHRTVITLNQLPTDIEALVKE
jgi:hypothetical protein